MTATNSTLHYENLRELPPGFLHPHPFANTSLIKDKRILIFCRKITWILYNHFKYRHISLFLLYKKTHHFKHTEVFEREIQPHKMVKCLCERTAVLQLQICYV